MLELPQYARVAGTASDPQPAALCVSLDQRAPTFSASMFWARGARERHNKLARITAFLRVEDDIVVFQFKPTAEHPLELNQNKGQLV